MRRGKNKKGERKKRRWETKKRKEVALSNSYKGSRRERGKSKNRLRK
jgi:hypothetical protein